MQCSVPAAPQEQLSESPRDNLYLRSESSLRTKEVGPGSWTRKKVECEAEVRRERMWGVGLLR